MDKTRIGYTNTYLDEEQLINLQSSDKSLGEQLIEDYKIKCSYCKGEIAGNWIVVIHNPREEETPIRMHFFCYDKKCASKWAKLSPEQRTSGEFK